MIESEKGIVGCVLIDSSCLYQVYKNLKPEMFCNDFFRETYRTMLAMYDNGQEINLMTLSQALESSTFDKTTIMETLKECVMSSPTSVMAKSYADVIIKEYKSRTVKELMAKIDLTPKNINNTIAEIMARCEELETHQTQRSKSLKEIVKENKDKYFKEKTETLVKTGLANLDECLGGLEKGDITVVGARPSVGKSALVTQIITNVARQGLKVGYFNLEMGESQVYERLVARQSNISLTRVRRAIRFLGEEELIYQDANNELEKLNIVVSTNTRKISEIKSESRHQGYDLIVIDYLQLIQAEKTYSNRASEVGDISKAIKSLAMELKVPVILLSQLNRVSEQNATKEPTMSELRESGDIEQDASNIILMWNMTKDRKLKGLKVEKNRQGDIFCEGVEFKGDIMTFVESKSTWENFQAVCKSHEQQFENLENETTPWD